MAQLGITPRLKLIAGAWFCLGLATLTRAETITDNFNTNVDYLANGVAGTIWDGVYFGANEFANAGTGGNCASSAGAAANVRFQTETFCIIPFS